MLGIMELDADTHGHEIGAIMPSLDTGVFASRAVGVEDPAEDEEVEEDSGTDEGSPSSDSGGHI